LRPPFECIEADHGHVPLELLLNNNDPQEQPVIGNTERDDLRRAGCSGWWNETLKARRTL